MPRDLRLLTDVEQDLLAALALAGSRSAAQAATREHCRRLSQDLGGNGAGRLLVAFRAPSDAPEDPGRSPYADSHERPIDTARRWGVSARRVRQLAGEQRIPGAFRDGHGVWWIPRDAQRPRPRYR